jgi:hypothetical protein
MVLRWGFFVVAVGLSVLGLLLLGNTLAARSAGDRLPPPEDLLAPLGMLLGGAASFYRVFRPFRPEADSPPPAAVVAPASRAGGRGAPALRRE